MPSPQPNAIISSAMPSAAGIRQLAYTAPPPPLRLASCADASASSRSAAEPSSPPATPVPPSKFKKPKYDYIMPKHMQIENWGQ